MSLPSLRGRSVLVTGGAGFIGSHLVDRLVEEGPRRIVVVDNLWLGKRSNLAAARKRHPAVRLHVADAASQTALREIIRRERVEVVFSLATIPLPASHARPRWAADRITRMATVAAELCRLGEFATLMHCSSSEAYGTAVTVPMSEEHPLGALTPYAAAKAAADLVTRSYWETFGIDAAVVRPFNNYGPRQNEGDWAGVVPLTLRRLREGERPVIYGDGAQTRDFIFVEDTAHALVRAYLEPRTRRRIINVASGHEITIADLIERLSALMGRSFDPIYRPERAADVHRHVADVSLARELLGFAPRVGIDEGLRRTVEWYLSTGDKARA